MLLFIKTAISGERQFAANIMRVWMGGGFGIH